MIIQREIIQVQPGAKLMLEIEYMESVKVFDKPVDADKLVAIVAQCSGLKVFDLKSETRKRDAVAARQVYCFIAHKIFKYPSKYVGKYINRDHTTVLHSVKECINHYQCRDNRITSLLKRSQSYFSFQIHPDEES